MGLFSWRFAGLGVLLLVAFCAGCRGTTDEFPDSLFVDGRTLVRVKDHEPGVGRRAIVYAPENDHMVTADLTVGLHMYGTAAIRESGGALYMYSFRNWSRVIQGNHSVDSGDRRVIQLCSVAIDDLQQPVYSLSIVKEVGNRVLGLQLVREFDNLEQANEGRQFCVNTAPLFARLRELHGTAFARVLDDRRSDLRQLF